MNQTTKWRLFTAALIGITWVFIVVDWPWNESIGLIPRMVIGGLFGTVFALAAIMTISGVSAIVKDFRWWVQLKYNRGIVVGAVTSSLVWIILLLLWWLK